MSTENIMHAYLIIGNEPNKKIEEILGKFKVKPIYTTTLTPSPSHSITTIRQISQSLAIKITGAGEYRAIVLKDAHLMTIPAQNAFLKTLEEPPLDTIIILTSPKEDLMLSTIISRCIIIPTGLNPPAGESNVNFKKQEEIFQKLSVAEIGEKVKLAEENGKSREDAVSFVQNQILFIHHQLHSPTPEVGLGLIKALLSARQDLSNNVNPKMVLFELLRNY